MIGFLRAESRNPAKPFCRSSFEGRWTLKSPGGTSTPWRCNTPRGSRSNSALRLSSIPNSCRSLARPTESTTRESDIGNPSMLLQVWRRSFHSVCSGSMVLDPCRPAHQRGRGGPGEKSPERPHGGGQSEARPGGSRCPRELFGLLEEIVAAQQIAAVPRRQVGDEDRADLVGVAGQ